MENITVIVQARCGSLRFPDKIFKKNKKRLYSNRIFIFQDSLNQKKINNFFLATTKNKSDDKLCNLFKDSKVKIFRGDENNVLSRYYKIAKQNKSNIIIRITGDCPFVDYRIIDKFINKILSKKGKTKFDYVSNTLNYTYPDGFDVEVFNFKSLELAYKNAVTSHDKEHVTPYIKRNKSIKKFNFRLSKNLSHIRLSVDQKEDLNLIKKILNELKINNFKLEDVLNFLNKKIFIKIK